MPVNDCLICPLCIGKRIKSFHRIRDLNTHITMKHGADIRIEVENGAVKVLGTKRAK